MADITQLKGFVSKGKTVQGKNGPFSTFTLAYGVKDKAGKWENFFFNITNYKSPTPPEDGSRVEVNGWFKPRYFDKNGVKHVSLDVQANEVTDVTGGNGAPAHPNPTAYSNNSHTPPPSDEPWNDLPF